MWTYNGKEYSDINLVCADIEKANPGHRVGFMGDFISVRTVDHVHPGYRGKIVKSFDIMLSNGHVVPGTRGLSNA